MLWTRPVFALAAVTLVLTAAALARAQTAQTAEQGATKSVVPAEAGISRAVEADIRRTMRIQDSSQARSTSQIWNYGIDGSKRDAALWRFRGLAIKGWPIAMGFTHASGKTADQLLESCESSASIGRASWRDYDRHGETFAAAGDTRRAIACYEKSVTLNPDNDSSFFTLMRLQNQDAVRQSSRYPYH